MLLLRTDWYMITTENRSVCSALLLLERATAQAGMFGSARDAPI
ncbi:hypothetical protein BS78_01G089800 [Paspalum vaginatum]|nr:hypothetical protein BS78_01G089800 [Paspalum vaginatum]